MRAVLEGPGQSGRNPFEVPKLTRFLNKGVVLKKAIMKLLTTIIQLPSRVGVCS
jgi:hypothetical protein